MSRILILLVSSVIGHPDYVVVPSVTSPARHIDTELDTLVTVCETRHSRLIRMDLSTLRDKSVRLKTNSVSKFEACFDQFAMIQTEALRLVCLSFGVAYKYVIDTQAGLNRDILDLNVPPRWHGPGGGVFGVMVNDLDELVGEIRAFQHQLDAFDKTKQELNASKSSIVKRIRLGMIREGESFDKAMKCLKNNIIGNMFPDPSYVDPVEPASELLSHYNTRLQSISSLRPEGWNLDTMSVANMRSELTATLSWIKTMYQTELIGKYNPTVAQVRAAHERTIHTIADFTTGIEFVKKINKDDDPIDANTLLDGFARIEVFLKLAIADRVTESRMAELLRNRSALSAKNDFGVLTPYKAPLMHLLDQVIKLETSLMTIKEDLADKKAESVSRLTMWRSALREREAEGPRIWALTDVVTECLDDGRNNFANIDFDQMINRLG
jgi:hypothetical protein